MNTDSKPSTHYRESGTGPTVVCIHANASSSSQWRPLMERLCLSYRVIAPDTHGAGKGPPWPANKKITLDDEVALLDSIFKSSDAQITLVGHSYGAAVALIAAIRNPFKVNALVLYEPTLFSLIDAATPPPNDVDGIREAVRLATNALAAGNRGEAAEIFIDFWMGLGTWRAKPEAQRATIEPSICNVAGWANALFTEATPLSAFKALDIPVLLMQGSESPESGIAVANLLAQEMSQVNAIRLDGLGHMGPLTHPQIVNAEIEQFVRNLASQRDSSQLLSGGQAIFESSK